MSRFTLSNPDAINGDQLAEEIRSALGIDVSTRYAFIPPNLVDIADLTPDQEVGVAALVQAHVPASAPIRVISKEVFMERFQDDEAVEIFSSRDPNVVKAYNTLAFHPRDEVDLDAPRTIGFLTYMESTAKRADGVTPLLGAGRAAEIRE